MDNFEAQLAVLLIKFTAICESYERSIAMQRRNIEILESLLQKELKKNYPEADYQIFVEDLKGKNG